MESLLIVGDYAPGLYLAIPNGGFKLPKPASASYSHKTPNSCMEKVGIDRYPFRSVKYQVETTPVVLGHGYTLSEYQSQEPSPDTTVIVSANATGNNRSRLAIDNGGYISYYVSNSRAYVQAYWIRPGNGGWYKCWGSITSGISLTYYCLQENRLMYYSFGNLPVNFLMPVRDILSAVHSYSPIPPSVRPFEYYGRYVVDSVQPGVIPGNLLDKILSAALPAADHDLGKIGFDLISQFKISDVNLPAFFVDAPKFGESSKDVVDSLLKFFTSKDIKSAVKDISKANLAYQYGDRLTIADSRALIDSFDKLRSLAIDHKPITAKVKDLVAINQPGMTGIDILRYTASAAPADPLSKGVYWLSQVANYSDVWDLIPFSFVVDWFLNIGDYLASEDAKVLNCTLSYNRILTSRLLKLELNQFELEGSLLSGTFVMFDRRAVDKVPAPDIDLQASLPRPAQWINGASLLTSLLIK